MVYGISVEKMMYTGTQSSEHKDQIFSKKCWPIRRRDRLLQK